MRRASSGQNRRRRDKRRHRRSHRRRRQANAAVGRPARRIPQQEAEVLRWNGLREERGRIVGSREIWVASGLGVECGRELVRQQAQRHIEDHIAQFGSLPRLPKHDALGADRGWVHRFLEVPMSKEDVNRRNMRWDLVLTIPRQRGQQGERDLGREGMRRGADDKAVRV